MALLVGAQIGGPVLRADAAAAPPEDNPQSAVTSDALPTAQVNGVVWDQVVVGDTVYAVGEFTAVRPAGSAVGQNETPRANLVAYQLSTGEFTTWAPTTNGRVRTITASPDGSKLYIGGSFTAVNGQSRWRIAALNTADGSLDANFKPIAGSDVFGIAATDSAVYLSGWFGSVNNVARQRLAAVSTTDGALLDWAPSADYTVYGIGVTASGDRVVVAGAFSNLNASPSTSLGTLDAVTGVSYPFAAANVIHNTGDSASMMSLKIVNGQVFSTGFSYGTGNFEGTLVADPYTGAIQNLIDVHGDTYDSVPMNGVVYNVSHHHQASNVGAFPEISPRRYYHSDGYTLEAKGTVNTNSQAGAGYGNFEGQPAGAIVHWYNDWTPGTFTTSHQAGWTVETGGDYLVIGGEFTAINGVAQQGLVRFGTRNVVTSPAQGPAGLRSESAPNLSSTMKGVNGNFMANYDRDGDDVTYKVIRADKGETNPVATLAAKSNPWTRPTLTFADPDVVPGWSYSYYVIAVDADGNAKTGDASQITVSTAIDPYQSAVVADGAEHYWRMGQASGTLSVPDATGGRALILKSGAKGGSAGAIIDDDDTATKFSGTTTGTGGMSGSAILAPRQFAIETWFQTNSRSGGKIVGFGNSQTGSSGNNDRQIYLSGSGQLTFGVYPGVTKTLTASGTYNDNKWHHVVASLSDAGMQLFVDGELAASDASVTAGEAYQGYWRVGGDRMSGWPNQGTSTYLNGTIDEVAIYPTALSAEQVASHYRAGTVAVQNALPTASFTATPADLHLAVDAAGSTDTDGTIQTYAWDFGDGARATGVTAAHDYAVPGTYQVTLTVVDDQGGVGTSTQPVTVEQADQLKLYAKDTFNRAGSRWGTAAVGGDWSDSGASYYSTNGSQGIASFSRAGDTAKANLVGVSAESFTLRTDVALDRTPTGGVMMHQNLVRVNGSDSYKVITRFESNGSVRLQIVKRVGMAETVLKTVTLANYTYAVGDRLNLRLDVTGTNPTTLALKAWLAGTEEPGASLATVTDSQAELQQAGSVGMISYTSGSLTSLPIVLSVDDYQVSEFVDTRVAPSAAFTSTTESLTAKFDAATSTDANGTIASYAWDFGDGSTGTGATASHTYAAAGTYQVKLTVTDNDGLSSEKVAAVEVVRVNVIPVAKLGTPVVDGLTVSVDGSGSSDSDGSIAAMTWSFGDGTAQVAGTALTHTYATAGTYTITLSVTDNEGATNNDYLEVTVQAVDPTLLAKDGFDRTGGGWGSAEVGGDWTLNQASQFSTTGTAGQVQVSAGGTRQAMLAAVSAQDVDITTDLSLGKAPVGGAFQHQIIARDNGGQQYVMTTRIEANGSLRVWLSKRVGTETTLVSTTTANFGYTAGEQLKWRFVVTGSGTTTLSGTVWRASEAEPTTPTVTSTDATPELQGAGAVGLRLYTGGGVTNGPLTASIDGFEVRKA